MKILKYILDNLLSRIKTYFKRPTLNKRIVTFVEVKQITFYSF